VFCLSSFLNSSFHKKNNNNNNNGSNNKTKKCSKPWLKWSLECKLESIIVAKVYRNTVVLLVYRLRKAVWVLFLLLCKENQIWVEPIQLRLMNFLAKTLDYKTFFFSNKQLLPFIIRRIGLYPFYKNFILRCSTWAWVRCKWLIMLGIGECSIKSLQKVNWNPVNNPSHKMSLQRSKWPLKNDFKLRKTNLLRFPTCWNVFRDDLYFMDRSGPLKLVN